MLVRHVLLVLFYSSLEHYFCVIFNTTEKLKLKTKVVTVNSETVIATILYFFVAIPKKEKQVLLC